MHGERMQAAHAHRPDVVGADRGHRHQVVRRRRRAHVRTLHPSPSAAVPVEVQRPVVERLREPHADRPDVIARDGVDAGQRVREGTLVRARYDGPRRPVPVFDQGPAGSTESVGSDGPSVVGRDGHDIAQLTVRRVTDVRGLHACPRGAVPMHDERPRDLLWREDLS